MHQSDVLKEKVAKKVFEYLLNDITKNKNQPDVTIWLGIGSGTTIKYFLAQLGKYYSEGSLAFNFVTVSSSIDSETVCRSYNFPIKQLADVPADKKLDYYIDGADEVDDSKRCLKGLGGASTREKLVRIESEQFYVLVDESKKVPTLGTKCPIVVEIVPFGFTKTLERINTMTPKPNKAVLRKGSGKMGFVITDNNNYLVDVYFTDNDLKAIDFEDFEKQLNLLPGVVETGLFASPADVVFIATSANVEVIH